MKNDTRKEAGGYIQLRPYLMMAFTVVVLSAIMSWIGYGQDIEYHAERVAALAAEMKNGFGIYRIYTTVCEGYGYASPMFYGDIFLYPAAILVATGVPLGISFRLFLASIMIFSFLSMYCCAKAVWGKEQAALVAYIYAFSPILLADIFIRYAVGEALAFIFIPVAILGFYRIVIAPYQCKKYCVVLSLGMSGLILSHIISTVLTTILLILLCLLFIRKILDNKRSILYLLMAAMLTVALTAYFIFPMLEQMVTTQFFVMNRQESNLAGNTAPLIGLFIGSEYFNLLNAVIEKIAGAQYRFTFDWFPGAYGYIFPFVLWTRWKEKNNVKSKSVDYCIWLSGLYLVISVVPFVQPILEPVVGFIKLPWRNLTFYMFFISIATGMILMRLWQKNKKSLVKVGLGVASFGTILCFGGLLMITVHNGMFPYDKLSTNSIGMGEYLPSNVPNYDYAEERGEKVWCSDENVNYIFSRENGFSILAVTGTTEETLFEVPVYMYRGYVVCDEETYTRFEPFISENGLVEFQIPQGYKGTVKIYYEGTLVQKVSNVISIMTALIMVLGWILKKKKLKESIA